jgi:hypothetical protein
MRIDISNKLNSDYVLVIYPYPYLSNILCTLVRGPLPVPTHVRMVQRSPWIRDSNSSIRYIFQTSRDIAFVAFSSSSFHHQQYTVISIHIVDCEFIFCQLLLRCQSYRSSASRVRVPIFSRFSIRILHQQRHNVFQTFERPQPQVNDARTRARATGTRQYR